MMLQKSCQGFVRSQEGQTPLADIIVTDGQHVTRTGSDGSFSLPGWEKCHFITVTVPAGYRCDAYYLPVSNTDISYDFNLTADPLTAQNSHVFLQISDTEIGESGVGTWIEDLRKLVLETNPAFLIHTGDICYEAGLKRHKKDMNSKNMHCTVRYVIGNHDYVRGTFGEELYESIYGPTWYSFDVGSIHYMVLPDRGGGDYPSLYTEEELVSWMLADLAMIREDQQVVIFDHVGPLNINDVFYDSSHRICLKDHRVTAWLFGHYHYNSVYRKNGILYISTPRPDSGGIDSSPACTRIVHVSESNTLTTETRFYDRGQSVSAENPVWNTKLKGHVLFCDTLMRDDALFLATAEDEEPSVCGVYCLDAASGNIRWFYQTQNAVKNNLAEQDGRIYALDAEGRLYGLDRKTGTLLFQNQIDVSVRSINTTSGLCLGGNRIFAGTPSHVAAFDPVSGNLLWKNDRMRGENSPAAFVYTGKELIVSSHWDALCALDPTTGKELWSIAEPDIRFRSSTPAVLDETHLLTTGRSAVMIIDTETGKIVSKTQLNGISLDSGAQPLVCGSVAYLPSSDRGLAVFDLTTQKLLYTFETGENILYTAPYTGLGSKTVESSPILYGNLVIFGANDGWIYGIHAENGNLIFRYFAGSAVLGKVTVFHRHIYAGTFSGSAVCFPLPEI